MSELTPCNYCSLQAVYRATPDEPMRLSPESLFSSVIFRS